MNAVEIEEAVSDLAATPFDREEFPYAFLAAFGNKDTTIKRLRSGQSNASDVAGGVLQRNNIHIAVCDEGAVDKTLKALRDSPKTTTNKAKFILATDGVLLAAEDLSSGEPIASTYADLAEHFGFFLPLAGISTVKEIKNNPIDVKATGRLNKLYVELLRENPEWGTEQKRPELNQFMARLIFCFFAEDTGIFADHQFTRTVDKMSDSQSGNTHEILAELFRAMDTPTQHEGRPDSRYRKAANIKNWADPFPYVNGGLFTGQIDCPQFSRMARSYLLRAGELDWQQINPDIFGSMIQAVADDDERGSLGMHYTSVPNILKVLNPLLLDDLRAQLAAAGDNGRALLNLRRRMSRIRVFDPACGSGNFLVIAYKQMRIIEAEINQRRGEPMLPSEISKKNFRGIEIRDFASEIARLALVIAEYQCDVLHRGPLAAKAEFLPLDEMNWITCGNALRLDWLQVCPPEGTNVKLHSDDLFQTPLDQPEINFDNEGGETFICGNPPYKGSQGQDAMQKDDLREAFHGSGVSHASLDYVSGWFIKATQYLKTTVASAAFVATNSICQGRQVESLWPHVCTKDIAISFAHTSFKWQNLATHNAGVIVVIVGLSKDSTPRKLFASDALKTVEMRVVDHINAYLVPSADTYVEGRQTGIGPRSFMTFGSMANDAGNLLLSRSEADEAVAMHGVERDFIRPFVGSSEFIRGTQRHCIWVGASEFQRANKNDWLRARFQANSAARLASPRATTVSLAERGYSFGEVRQTGSEYSAIVVPGVSSESREYLPVGLLSGRSIISNLAFAMFDAPLWNMALIASKLHLVWIATVCGKLKTDYRYSNTLGWNTFPVPPLTDQDKSNLTRCAEDILLARERHFPSTIADLYDPETMPGNLRAAHEANDEALERIYIGRRFKNDTERLEKLFEMYTKLTSQGIGNREQGTARKSKKQVTA